MSTVEKKLLHYVGRAISDFNMIESGDRVMVCLSGGKDSFTLLRLLHLLKVKSRNKFEVFSFTLDQAQPGWDDTAMRAWLDEHGYAYDIERRDTYSIVKEKIPEGQTYCSLCSRLRRGNIYRYAKEHGFNKIALGHHRDDLIQSLLMSILYNGVIRSMPPKLLTDDKRHVLIRPLAYCQERDIITYMKEQNYPIIPCTLCGSQENMTRKRVKQLIADLAASNPKIPSNMLRALSNVQRSQLMDRDLWDFKALRAQTNSDLVTDTMEEALPWAEPAIVNDNADDGVPADLETEVTRLKSELAAIKMERDLLKLKKATVYFAKESRCGTP